MDYTIVQRANKGAELLDKSRPGWVGAIDRPISILSVSRCILGQVYGDFLDGVLKLDMGAAQYNQANHGFELTPEEYMGDDVADIAGELAAAWYAEIEKRSAE